MTRLPTPPASSIQDAGPLPDTDLLASPQVGVTRRATLGALKALLAGGAAGPSGSTGSIGSDASSSGSPAPAGRLGHAAVTTAVRNTAATPAAVTVPTAPSRSLPAYAAVNANESPNGKVLNASNHTTDRIVYGDGTVLTLTPSPTQPGLFRILINGSPMSGRVDLVNFSNPSIDDAKQVVYHHHRAYFQTDHGLPDTTWFVIEGTGPDCDTEGDDPRNSILVADAVAPVGDPPYGLGVHCASIGDQPRFDTWIAEFNRSVGRPAYVNGFLSFDRGFSGWGNEAYTAARSLAHSPVGRQCVPVVGMPMAVNGRFGPPANNRDFNDFASGSYDQYVKDAVKSWLNFFDEVHIRPGYEANGTFMPWFWGGQTNQQGVTDAVTPPLWINAFKRIYAKCHEAGKEASATSGRTKTVLVTWNPCHQNGNSGRNPRDMYPGEAYCDYHGLDIYSPQYAQDSSNWSGDGATYSSSERVWRIQQALNPLNRIHFWDYPAAKFGPNGGNTTGGTAGWGMQDAIAFAKQCGKPLAFPECGSGQNFADEGKGPVDDHVFPYYLRSRCDQAVNMGVPILYANIWCSDEKDGGWGCLFRQRVRTQVAWASAFGGTGAALKHLVGDAGSGSGSTGSAGTTGSAGSGPVGRTNRGSPGSASSTGSTGTGTGVATARVTDTGGRTAAMTLDSYRIFYVNETGLRVNIFHYLDNGTNKPTVGSSADGSVASLVITRNGTATISSPGLARVTTYARS